MTDKPRPQWQPLSMLPLLTETIDGTLAEAKEMLGNVQKAITNPYVFDDDTVDRVLRLYTGTLEMTAIYAAQLERWRTLHQPRSNRPRSTA